MIYENILETIGNTPMVKINRMNPNPAVIILAKLEFFNPSGSVKDRIAKFMVEEAEKDGHLKSDGTIVENTSGNTGLGLAMVAAVKGYKLKLTMADKVSSEKIELPKKFGAEVTVTPTDVPADSPQSYYEVAKRIARETPNSIYTDQYNNPQNIEAHYRTTGPEIWKDTDGKIDILIAGAGTGGTITGTAKYLKEMNPKIKIIAVDPYGSVFYDYFKSKKLITPGRYKMEGIGEDMLVKAMDFSLIDDIIQISDQDAFDTAREMVKKEGIFAGGTSGAALWAAQQVAKKEKEPKTIVTIFPDSGYRYLTKFYDDNWMKENKFLN